MGGCTVLATGGLVEAGGGPIVGLPRMLTGIFGSALALEREEI